MRRVRKARHLPLLSLGGEPPLCAHPYLSLTYVRMSPHREQRAEVTTARV